MPTKVPSLETVEHEVSVLREAQRIIAKEIVVSVDAHDGNPSHFPVVPKEVREQVHDYAKVNAALDHLIATVQRIGVGWDIPAVRRVADAK